MGADKPNRHGAVFLDRDGVINRNVWNPATLEYESPLAAEDFELIPGVVDALHELRLAEFPLFLVSNQPNHAKGKASLATLAAIHEKLLQTLARERIEFAAFFYCLHHPQGITEGYAGTCLCRKPSPYLLLKAAEEFELDLGRSWMVGDRLTDVECGHAAGARAILIGQVDQASAGHPDAIVHDLAAAVKIILGQRSSE